MAHGHQKNIARTDGIHAADRRHRPARRGKAAIGRRSAVVGAPVSPVQASVVERSMAAAAECLGHGQFEQATQVLGQVLRHVPDYADAYNLLGVAARGRGETEVAIGHFRHAVASNDRLAGAHANLGVALVDGGHSQTAIPALMRALDIDPENAIALYGMGRVLLESAAFAEAEALLRRATDVSPRFAEAFARLGHALVELDRYRGAERACRRAIELRPELAFAHNVLGRVYTATGRLEEALESCQQAAILDPTLPAAKWNLAGPLLALGQLKEGWDAHEYRRTRKGAERYAVPWPVWKGEPLDDKAILVRAEQGLREEVLFSSCFRDLILRARHCVIECDPRLKRLFKRSFPEATVHGVARNDQGWLAQLPKIDSYIRAGSLMRYFRTDVSDFPDHKGYLRSDAAARSAFANRLAAMGPGLKVGISWRGGKGSETRRAFSALDAWRDILAVRGVQFINLQYDDSQAEIAVVGNEFGAAVHEIEGLDWNDLDSVAALSAALDLVITPSNTVMALAGAVDAPLWLLDAGAGFGMFGTGRSLWYPRARVCRREASAPNWSAVLRRVAADLAIRARNTATGRP